MTEHLTRDGFAHSRPTQPYTRQAWEQTVMLSGLHHNARHVALALAHYAGPDGRLPAGGVQDVASLAGVTDIGAKQVRFSLRKLEAGGWIRRPSIHGWPSEQGVRPLTLTMPPAPADAPPSTDGPHE